MKETEQRKEDSSVNNSQTLASFRRESMPKVNPCVQHT